LWGLDTHPLNSNIFITAGDDGFVRVYSLERKELVCIIIFKLSKIE